MSEEYYVFDDEATAQAALDYINGSDWFPVVYYKNNVPASSVNKWAESVTQRLDGKWVFPRVTSDLMDAYGVSAEDRQAFLDAFNPAIETFQDSWFTE